MILHETIAKKVLDGLHEVLLYLLQSKNAAYVSFNFENFSVYAIKYNKPVIRIDPGRKEKQESVA